MADKATGSRIVPNTIAGAWKFRSKGGTHIVTTQALINTAKELVNQNPGGGHYVDVFIRGTADDELGICFMYEPGYHEGVNADSNAWLEVYKDFFMRRHGIAFKGFDIGHTVTMITIDSTD